MPVEIEDWNARFLLQIVEPTVSIDESVRSLEILFMLAIPAALFLAAIAAAAITRAAFRPITSMVETVRTISANNLSSRVQLSRVNDEIRLLGETFNNMIQRLHEAFEGQRQFIADASHELRTPLTVICSELEFIQQHTKDEKVRESIRTSLTEIDRLARMTKGMLLLSTMDDSQSHLSLETIRLDELIVECVQLLKTIATEKKIDLQIRIDEVVEIEADRDKIKSALVNLVDNAVKYSEPGGGVTISLAVPLSGPPMARVVVQDNGAGIPPTDLQHVFKRFYRSAISRADHGGSGLGLSIVERVVKLHRGKISLQSEPQKGTTAVLDLPLSHSA
jgi:signal transduction histidine kinase